MAYGSNAEVQKLAFGAVDSTQDTRTTTARDAATAIINAKLGLENDLTTPNNQINTITNLLAAGIILSGQISIDSQKMHPFYDQGIQLLDSVDISSLTEIQFQPNIMVDRF